MPDCYQRSPDRIREKVKILADRGIQGIILFGIPEKKDEKASRAYAEDGIVQKTIRAIRQTGREMTVIADICLCEYMDHGHCGVVTTDESGEKQIDNDRTLPLLEKTACAAAEAGADMVAPSGMMDGMVQAIRRGLDREGFERIPILSYAAKYKSSFYGPFRDAAESPPGFGDRSTYQMDYRNRNEALKEMEIDVAEEADILMVKPALSYLDIIREARDRFDHPIFAYSVSGEYAMVRAAAEKNWIQEKQAALELLTSIHRAGATSIITYWAEEATQWL